MNNRFDERYDIRIALYSEIPEIMNFIDNHWKKGHILARDREFFEYEMVIDGNVNFVIAKNKEDKKIEGVLGFLPCSENKDELDIWGVIWKTVPNAMPMLGIELKKRCLTLTGARTDLGIGANASTSVPLLRRICHYYTAKMKHYYRLADRKEYFIAVVKNKTIPDKMIVDDGDSLEIVNLVHANDLKSFYDFSLEVDTIPQKDFWYYNRRFYEHPAYEYSLWGLKKRTKKAVMVTRKQKCNGSSAIRIVDYLGDQSLFSFCGDFLDSFLQDSEYIDFYFDGFNEDYAIKAGMIELTDGDKNIIPDYFYPYEQRNVDIYVDSSNNMKKCLFFKADGDQDRPN